VCLAFPMKVEKLHGPMAEVSAGELSMTVSVQLISSVKKGDYVLVHAGIAIEKIDKARADELLTLIDELGQTIDEERQV
jgi:hydrogenase expression/formation protein HypC